MVLPVDKDGDGELIETGTVGASSAAVGDGEAVMRREEDHGDDCNGAAAEAAAVVVEVTAREELD